MDVTRSNFKQTIPLILDAIDKSAFLSIDTELTGLQTSKNMSYRVFDSLQQRYSKFKDSASNFQILQYGICTFELQDDKKLLAKPFNFYLFPRSNELLKTDLVFSCQSGSIDFLVNHNFDFNKTFYDGIPFMSQEEYSIKKEFVAQERDDIILNEKDEDFVLPQLTSIENWLQTKENNNWKLEINNAYSRRLLYQEVKKKFNGFVQLEKSMVGGKTFLEAKCLKIEDKSLETIKKDNYLNELDEQFGFSRIIKEIINKKKIVVGHNLLLDICHTYQKFIGQLPNDVGEFKSTLNENFPLILDTKYIAKSKLAAEIESTHLGDLFEITNKLVKDDDLLIKCCDGFNQYSEDSNKFHEAGYDAYCTGSAFAKMMFSLSKKENISMADTLKQNYLLSYSNKFNLMSSIIDSFNVTESESKVFKIKQLAISATKNNVFLLTDFVEPMNHSQIVETIPSEVGKVMFTHSIDSNNAV
ncbi:Ribonuclease CAF1 domain-containing protein, partial [Rozella allomycis CSF55]